MAPSSCMIFSYSRSGTENPSLASSAAVVSGISSRNAARLAYSQKCSAFCRSGKTLRIKARAFCVEIGLTVFTAGNSKKPNSSSLKPKLRKYATTLGLLSKTIGRSFLSSRYSRWPALLDIAGRAGYVYAHDYFSPFRATGRLGQHPGDLGRGPIERIHASE